jgi:hypothetical protein
VRGTRDCAIASAHVSSPFTTTRFAMKVAGSLSGAVTVLWFAPFYLDVGTGATKLTWQGFAGVGYAYRWGDVVAG